MRIISYNVNGIRAAIKKGFTDWLKTDPADIICLQETKAHKDNVDFKSIEDLGYQTYWFSAAKKEIQTIWHCIPDVWLFRCHTFLL